MAVSGEGKPILDIGLDSSSFEEFVRKYQKYREAVKESSKDWDAVNDSVSAASNKAEDLNSAIEKHLHLMDDLQKKSDPTKSDAEGVLAFWGAVTASSKVFKSHITDATSSLAKWTGLTALFSSILSAGGITGIDRLALGTSSFRASAASQGNSYGEQSSFDVNFARLGGSANLDWVLNALGGNTADAWKIGAITGSASETNRIKGEDPAQAFADLLPYMKRIIDAAPATNRMGVAASYGIPPELAVVLAHMSPDEVAQIVKNYRSGVNPLGLPPDVLRKWNDLNQTIDVAGTRISSEFEDKLALLAPGMGDLGKALGDLITYVLRDGGSIDVFAKRVGSSLESFSSELSQPFFVKGVEEIASGVGAVAAAVAAIIVSPLDAIGKISDAIKNSAPTNNVYNGAAPPTPPKDATPTPGPFEAIKKGAEAIGGAVASGASAVGHAAASVGRAITSGEVGGAIGTAAGTVRNWWESANSIDLGNGSASDLSGPFRRDFVPQQRNLDPQDPTERQRAMNDLGARLSGRPQLKLAPPTKTPSPNAKFNATNANKPQVSVVVPEGHSVTVDSSSNARFIQDLNGAYFPQ